MTDVALSDIDGTAPGRAMVLSVHGFETDNPHLVWSAFDEASYPNPMQAAHNFIASFADHGDDYWDYHTVVANERARYIRWQEQMYALLGDEYTDDKYDLYLSTANNK